MSFVTKRPGQLVGITIATAYSLHYASTSAQWHFIDNVNLIFHEAGHVLFILFGEFLHVAMGSGLQVLLPLAIAVYFWVQRQTTSAAICLMWTGMSLINVSVYAGDAILMQLPLLGGESVMHDWNYLLSSLNLLSITPTIAAVVYGLGATTIGIGIALAYWSAVRSAVSAKAPF